MGGLANQEGVITDGTEEEIRAEVSRIIREVGREGFILGADCTLPGEIGYERIRTAAEAARRVKQ